MNKNCFDNSVKLITNNCFELDETFNCGQCFRWNQLEDGSFSGVAFGKYLNISKDQNTLIFKNSTKEDLDTIWYNYFDLNLDYEKIKHDLSNLHPILKEAIKYSKDIHILKQEPWEALCSFIISQNNNIPRIKGIIERLCQNFGEEIGDGIFSFPSYSILCNLSEEELAPLRCGFRSAYILDAARRVESNEINFDDLKKMPIEKARGELLKIKGVGPKVAECTLLYGLHKLDAFPIDVWMKRAMETFFENKSPEFFGEYAGIAQQYIFHYIRTKNK